MPAPVGTATTFGTGAAASATAVATKPAGVVLGHTILIWCCQRNTAGITWSCPGFLARPVATSANDSQQLLWRSADGTEASTFTVTASTSTTFEGDIQAWSGCDPAQPFDPVLPAVSGQINASALAMPNPGLTTVNDGDEIIWWGYSGSASGGTPAAITLPAGLTSLHAQGSTTNGAATNVGVRSGHETQATHGATGALNGSMPTTHINGTMVVALQAPSGGGGTPPFLAGETAVAATNTATEVDITVDIPAHCAVVVMGSIALGSAMVIGAVTDTAGNDYVPVLNASGAPYAWIALDVAALLTADTAKVTVAWSTAGNLAKDVQVIGCPGIASAQAVDTGALATAADNGTAPAVTSGVPAATGEVALMAIANPLAGGAPTSFTGGFTSLGSAHITSQAYLTTAWASAGSGSVTGGATIAAAVNWGAIVILLSTVPISAGGSGGLVGAFVGAGTYGSGDSQSTSIAKWITLSGRPMPLTRVYFGPGAIPASFAAAGLAQHVGVRKVLLSVKPAYTTLSASDLAKIDHFLADCKANGLVAAVTMYHEPISEKLTADQYIALVKYYGPTVRKYYPLIYCQSSYPLRPKGTPANAQAYYPGDAWVDEVAFDFYCISYTAYAVRLDVMANVADGATPPKPFSIWEYGVQSAGPALLDTQAAGTTYMKYIKNFMAARLAAGKPNGDLNYFNAPNVNSLADYSIQPGSYLIALYQAIYDTLNNAAPPSGPQTWHVSAALDITASINATASGGGAPPPPPPPPPPPLPIVSPVFTGKADWTFGAGPRQPAGGVSLALTDARSRTVTFRTAADQYHEASFAIDGRSPQASAIQELTTDLLLYRNTELLTALRVVPTQDDLDADSHTVTVTALDYREVLRRRLVFPDDDILSWDSTDQALIAWQLIRQTQARKGGDLGIVRGFGQVSGRNRTWLVNSGEFVGDHVSNIGLLAGGYDWDITPYGEADLRLDVWTPQRGSDRGVILEHGGNLIQSATRTVDPTTYANSWLVTGDIPQPDDGGGGGVNTPAIAIATQLFADEPGIASDPAGRWDQVDGTQLKDQAALQDRLNYHLATSVSVIPAYTVVLQPGAWGGPGHIWLGDLVTVRIKSGRLNVNDQLRVMEIAVAIGDNGDETVTLSIGQIATKITKTIPKMLRRLRSLETL